MFNPTQADVRRFLCAVHAKTAAQAPMEAIETLASLWIAEHPEYHADLQDADAAVARNYDETPERSNPFLHLSMHLSVGEQATDQLGDEVGVRVGADEGLQQDAVDAAFGVEDEVGAVAVAGGEVGGAGGGKRTSRCRTSRASGSR